MDEELIFPNELEFKQENAYLAYLKEQEQNEQWFEEQSKIQSMKKPKKIAKIRVIREEEEKEVEFIPYNYTSDLWINSRTGKGYFIQ